jgi:hypothetical protein
MGQVLYTDDAIAEWAVENLESLRLAPAVHSRS